MLDLFNQQTIRETTVCGLMDDFQDLSDRVHSTNLNIYLSLISLFTKAANIQDLCAIIQKVDHGVSADSEKFCDAIVEGRPDGARPE
jgi:hypothetical protein